MAKSKKKSANLSQDEKAHPWRVCPLGKYWVRAHPRNRVSSKGKPYTQQMPGICRSGSSHKDHLYKDEIHEVAARSFSTLTGPPSSNQLDFGTDGSEYDALIRGWTQYWNDILKPSELLDADLVKALIASESGFNPSSWNRRRGKNAAYGLMQVLNASVQLLKDSKELRDHFINLTNDDMKDPNLSICAGIRWLIRKKQIREARLKRPVSWRDAVAEYKDYDDLNHSQMRKFDGFYARLKKQ